MVRVQMTKKNIVITGKPGCGKTTLIREICRRYPDRVGGFFTDEVRIGSARDSFVLKTLDGRQGLLAKKGMASAVKLNKYGVDLAVLETIGIGALRGAMDEGKIVIIDELGTLEMLSAPFRAAVADCLNGPCRVCASIRYNAQPFTDEIRHMDDTELLQLSRDNAAQVRAVIEGWINDTDNA